MPSLPSVLNASFSNPNLKMAESTSHPIIGNGLLFRIWNRPPISTRHMRGQENLTDVQGYRKQVTRPRRTTMNRKKSTQPDNCLVASSECGVACDLCSILDKVDPKRGKTKLRSGRKATSLGSDRKRSDNAVDMHNSTLGRPVERLCLVFRHLSRCLLLAQPGAPSRSEGWE